MFKLSYLIILMMLTFTSWAQMPHGEGFRIDCATCHNSEGWKVTKADMSFDHTTTSFKLTGQHQEVNCKSCHQSLKFKEAKSECVACHTDMHNNTLGPDCSRCHDTKNWIIQNTSRLHQLTRFPLFGNHAVADCASCHPSATTLRFEPLGIECIDCHRSDYLATNNPSHQQVGYSTNCMECHGVKSTGWDGANFEHGFFPLTQGHRISCVECHKQGGFKKISSECISCHQNEYSSTTRPNHDQAGIYTSCVECHTTRPGWSPADYKQHDAMDFPIYSGEHKGEWNSCTDCHTTNSYSTFSCVNCHEHTQSKMDSEHSGISSYSYNSITCFSCHPQGNKLGSFDHNTSNFQLTGAHTTVLCASCHINGYAGTSTECNACHQKDFAAAQGPNHTAAGIAVDCKTCHTTTAWQPSSFKHATTGFELTGGHSTIVQCSNCHLGSTTTASSECVSCHQVQYNNAEGHVASKFPTDCKMCHTSVNWLQTTFNHATTNFPLTGAHSKTDCASCHANGYAGTSTECNACHQKDFAAAQIPNHTAAGLPVDCKTCHSTSAWQPSSFKHGTTGFELTGGHSTIAQCSSCHLGSTTTASAECVSCHQVQYNNAKGHVASKFPTDCKMCHTSANWLQTTFNHATTNFPLTGAHSKTDCASCHANSYAGTSTECNACHQKDFSAAQTPNHTTAGLPVDCKTCHTTSAWQPSSFKHGTTGFELTGGHSTIVQCLSCHLGSTTTASSECVSCHQVQYNNAKGHVASKFPTDCKMCHTSANWLQTTFNHATTNFPLTGGHSKTDCASCHANGYVGTSTECNSCHQTDYNGATNPNHKTLALPVTCADCHTTNAGWQPASFGIHSNYYPLTGAHATIAKDCAACHKGTYVHTPNTCYACHTTDYNKTKNPSHSASQFATDCTICHTNKAWVPSTFNHTQYFPISSGRHKFNCIECHTTPSNYNVFSCILCHEHRNAHHRNQGSDGCYRCHPTGQGD